MEFSERIQVLAERVPAQLTHIQSEEGTKNSLVLPFIAALGYNVFDSAEVTTDYPAGIGLLNQETVDYTVLREGQPILLFECIPHTRELGRAPSPFVQRVYQSAPSAFAVLTNGLQYRFYSDLESPRRLDRTPFYEFDILHNTPQDIKTLAWFSKSGFDPDAVLSGLRTHRLALEVQEVMHRQLREPSEEFLRFLTSQLALDELPRDVKAQFPLIVQAALREWLEQEGRGQSSRALPHPDGAAGAPAGHAGPPAVRKLQPLVPPPASRELATRPSRRSVPRGLLAAMGLAALALVVMIVVAPLLTQGAEELPGEPVVNLLLATEEIAGADDPLEVEAESSIPAPTATRQPSSAPAGERGETATREAGAAAAGGAAPETTVRIAISDAADDAEEVVASGEMNLASRDLEMTGDNNPTPPQLIGLRFQNVDIPRGATVQRAYLSFTTDEPNQSDATLIFQGAATDDAAPFDWDVGNISRRARTGSAVAWNDIPPWMRDEEAHASPDLSTIVQEIVDRPGWEQGNALALIVTGTGERVAEAYDGNPELAPVLHVEYIVQD